MFAGSKTLFSGGVALRRPGGENVERVGKGVELVGEITPPVADKGPEEGILSHTSKLT